MGSLVLAGPMFVYLKKKYPEAELYALVFERNRECLEMLGVIPQENIFSVNGDAAPAFLKSSMLSLLNIRKQKVDAVLDGELFSRISSIYSFLSGAGIRAGFHRHTQEGLYRGDFINRPVLYNPYHHMATQFVTLAHAIDPEPNGVPVVKRNADSGDCHLLQLTVSPEAINTLRNRLIRDFSGIESKRRVLIYPGGGLLPIRAWPIENFCVVTDALLKIGCCVGIIGLKEDQELAHRITSILKSDFCFDMTGYTRTVRELITLFHLASLLITNDGGPGHLASLTPISSIILFGPETPVLYGPLGKKAISLHVPLSCSPCLTAYNHRNSPCDGNNVCLKSISPERVLSKAYEVLNGSA